MGYAFTSAFMFAALFSFISGSPFVFIETLRHRAARTTALIFGGMMIFMTIGSLLNARFVPVFGAEQASCVTRSIVPASSGPMRDGAGLIEARYGTIGMWPFLLCFGAADRDHQPDRAQLDGDGAAALSAHGGHGLVADGRHARSAWARCSAPSSARPSTAPSRR